MFVCWNSAYTYHSNCPCELQHWPTNSTGAAKPPIVRSVLPLPLFLWYWDISTRAKILQLLLPPPCLSQVKRCHDPGPLWQLYNHWPFFRLIFSSGLFITRQLGVKHHVSAAAASSDSGMGKTGRSQGAALTFLHSQSPVDTGFT